MNRSPLDAAADVWFSKCFFLVAALYAPSVTVCPSHIRPA